MASPSTPQQMAWPAGVFAATAFLGAALLFLLEPVAGKSLLPWYGGTPAVWNTCVFFFQFVLLLGYLYAHLLQRWPVSRQLLVHAVLLLAALVLCPIRFRIDGLTGPAQNPTAVVLLDLAASVGLVFFLLSTTAPLLQAWYVAAGWPGNPYLFYLTSNAGSFLGLLIYPTWVEFWWPLSRQCAGLNWGFAGFAALTCLAGVLSLTLGHPLRPVDQSAIVTTPHRATGWRQRWCWLAWSMCPSSLMLGVTTFLSTEIAPMPALWMLPLGLYLLTFIVAFSQPPAWVMTASGIVFSGLAVLVAVSGSNPAYGELASIALQAALLFCGALALHGRLAAARPDVRQLTEFYLWISLGGLAGSMFNSLLAPAMFNWLAEYPLAIMAGLALVRWPPLPRPWPRALLPLVRAALAAAVFIGFAWEVYFSAASKMVMLRERTFFGAFEVKRGRHGVMHQLVHGRTIHGMQVASRDRRERRPPLTYYFFTGPIGQIVLGSRGTPITQSVGVVGLGVGSLAAYAEAGERYTFYEIDPAIERVAQDDRYFTFLSDARGRGAVIRVVLGDARLRLREAPAAEFGLLVLDAFTSDAIPVHLLTKDALQEYASKLNSDGVLAFHISNQYVDLEPVLANIAAEMNWTAYVQLDDRSPEEELRRGKSPSKWLIMSADAHTLKPLWKTGAWKPCRQRPELGVWTDDQSNIWSAMLRTSSGG